MNIAISLPSTIHLFSKTLSTALEVAEVHNISSPVKCCCCPKQIAIEAGLDLVDPVLHVIAQVFTTAQDSVPARPFPGLNHS